MRRPYRLGRFRHQLLLWWCCRQLRSLDGVESCASLTSLSANTNSIATFPRFGGDNRSLTRLLLYHNHLTHLPSQALLPLKTLTNLDLGRNRLCALDGQALSECPSLVRLVLSQVRAGPRLPHRRPASDRIERTYGLTEVTVRFVLVMPWYEVHPGA
jgi:hypothetical protein